MRTLSCLVGHMLCCLNVGVNDEAGKGGYQNRNNIQ